MGQIATPTAILRLSSKVGKDQKIDFQILDIFANIQDDICLRKLNETLQSRSAPIRNYARLKLTQIGVKAVPMLIENLLGRDCDQQILSLNILQSIGDESAALAIRNLINNHPKNANVRFAAFEALADLSNRKGDYVLAGGLSDPDSNVRLTAAKAIDRNLDTTLLNGVKNMVNNPGEEAHNIIKAIIDAQVENLFTGLLDVEYFQESTINYLGKFAHRDIRAFYIDIMTKKNLCDLAEKIKQLAQEYQNQSKWKVCAVDDSRMVLHLYRSIITELGYEVILFSDPREAIDWLQNNQPDFLCTDLNMPEITGIDLIREVRKKYTKEMLPIMLVTTQNEINDNKAAWKAGVSGIIYKPFDSKMISDAFANITDQSQT
jgi:CheY-like chemotaxis protein